MSINNFDEFKTKSVPALVGDQILQVSEYSIAKRDAVMSIIFDDVNIIDVIKPIYEKAVSESGESDEVSIHPTDIVDVLRQVMGKGLTKISTISLNTETNRRIVNVDSEQTMNTWISENLSMRQEVEVLKAVFEVNDFVNTIKNFLTLVNPTAS